MTDRRDNVPLPPEWDVPIPRCKYCPAHAYHAFQCEWCDCTTSLHNLVTSQSMEHITLGQE